MISRWAVEPRLAHSTSARSRGMNWWRPGLVLIAGSAYWITQFTIYATLISPRYGYLAMGWEEPDPVALAVCFAVAVLAVLALPQSIRRPSELMLWVFWAAVVTPTSYIPHVSGHLDALAATGTTVMCAAALVILAGVARRTGRLHLPEPPISWRVAVATLFAIALALNLYVFSVVGYRPSGLGLGEVYTARLAFRVEILSLPRFVGYAIPWVSVIINPLVLAVGLYRGWYLRVGVPVALATLGLYAIDGQKLVLFTPAFVVVVFIIFRVFGSLQSTHATWGLIGVMAIASALTPVAGGLIPEVLVRRILMIPGQLVGGYVEYYSQEPWTYLQQSRFFNWTGVLAEQPSYVIGRFLFRSDVQNANASFMADGYASLGVAGVLLSAVVAGAILGLIDSLTARHTTAMAVAAASPLAITLTNSPLQTALLTGGVGVLCALLLFLPGHDPIADEARARAPRARREARLRTLAAVT